MLLRAEKGQRRPADRQRRRESPPRGPQKEPPPRTPRPWPCGLQSCETNFCCSGVAACGTSLRPPQAPDTPHVGSVAWGVRAGTAGRPSGNLGNCLQVESVNRKEFIPGDTTGLEGPPERAGDAAAGPVSLPNRAPSKSRSAWKVNANFCKRPCSGPADSWRARCGLYPRASWRGSGPQPSLWGTHYFPSSSGRGIRSSSHSQAVDNSVYL